MKRINILMQSLLGLCVVCFSLLAGCIHEDLSASASVDYKIVSVDAQANNVLFTITSNTSWTISSNEDWCTPTPSEGVGTQTINIIVDSNAESTQRTANLSLNCGGVTTGIEVIQSGVVSTLEVSPVNYTVDNDAQSLNIAIMANASWTAVTSTSEADDEWLTINTTSGENNGFVTATVTENDTFEDREAVITFYANVSSEETLVKTVTVKQLSQGLPSLILSQSSVAFSALTDSKSVTYVSNITDIVASSDFSWCEVSVVSGSIKISVPTNTSLNSRTATVTVIGVVEGSTVSSQIIVSQSGMSSPEITLLKDYLSVSCYATSAEFSWLNVSGASVMLGNTSSWIHVSSTMVGNKITAYIDENISDEARIGYIELIATNASGQQTFYYITIYQSGVGAPIFVTTPSSASLDAYAGSSKFVVTANDCSTITYDGSSSSVSWLYNIDVEQQGDSGFIISYDYYANTSDSSRSGSITLLFVVGGQGYLHTISVSQAGLGAPAVSSLENIFLQADQTTHTQSIWLLDGEDENVTFQVNAISYSTYASGTGSDSDQATEWITSAQIVDRNLTITTLENFESEVRYGEITIFATRDNATTVITISVTQGSHAGAGITGLDQELYFDWEAVTDAKYYFAALNNSTITIAGTTTSGTSGWIHDATIVSITDGLNDSGDLEGSNDKVLKFSIDEYNGGETGSYREGVITLKADNGNSNVVYYDVLIRQYEPSAALASSIPDEIILTYSWQKTELDIDLQNNAKIVKAYSTDTEWLTLDSPFASFTSSSESLAYTAGVESLTYTAKQFTGATGESRTAYIYLTVQNNNANTMTYVITVTQGEPLEPVATMPETIYLNYPAYTDISFAVDPDSSVTGITAWVYEPIDDDEISVDMLTIGEVDWSGDALSNAKVYFSCDEYDGKEGESRTGTIVVRVTSDHANDQLYYVNVIQGEPASPVISAIPTYEHTWVSTYTSEVSPESVNYTYELPYTLSGDGIDTVTAEVSKQFTKFEANATVNYISPWLSFCTEGTNTPSIVSYLEDTVDAGDSFYYALKAYDGSMGDYRGTTLTLTATGDYFRSSVTYVDIIQYAQEDAGATADDILIGYEGTDGNSVLDDSDGYEFDAADWQVVSPNLVNGSTIKSVSSNEDWLVIYYGEDDSFMVEIDGVKDATSFYYNAMENTTGETRYATITYQVENANKDVAEYYIKVEQTASIYSIIATPSSFDVSGAGIQGWSDSDDEAYPYKGHASVMLDFTQNGVAVDLADTTCELVTTGVNYFGRSDDWIELIDREGTELDYQTNGYDDIYTTVAQPVTDSLRFEVAENTTGQIRTGTITVVTRRESDGLLYATKTITIRQSNTSYEVIATPAEITASATGVGEDANGDSDYADDDDSYGTISLSYMLDGLEISASDISDYTYGVTTTDSSWAILLDSGYEAAESLSDIAVDSSFDYVILPNTTDQARTASFTVKLYDGTTVLASKIIKITQEARSEVITNLQSSVTIPAVGYDPTLASADADEYSADGSFSFSFNVSDAVAASSSETSYVEVEVMNGASWLYATADATNAYTSDEDDLNTATVKDGKGTVYFNASANLTGSERTGQLQLTAVDVNGGETIYTVDVVQPAYTLGLSTTPFAQYASLTEGGAYGTVALTFSDTTDQALASLYDVDTRAIAEDWIVLVSEDDYEAYVALVAAYEEALAAYEADPENEGNAGNKSDMEAALADLQYKFETLYDAATSESFEIDIDNDEYSAKLYYICDVAGERERSATIKVVSKSIDGDTITAVNIQYFDVTQSPAIETEETYASMFAKDLEYASGNYEYQGFSISASGETIYDVIAEYTNTEIDIAEVTFGEVTNCTVSLPDDYLYNGEIAPTLVVEENSTTDTINVTYSVLVRFTDGSYYIFYVKYSQYGQE